MVLLCLLMMIAVSAARLIEPEDFNNGTNIQLWTCKDSIGQKWELMSDNTVRLAVDGKCMDISNSGASDGSNVWLFTCDLDDLSHQTQKWSYNFNGTITSYVSGLCLEAQNSDTMPGTNVQINECTGSDNQKWTYNTTTKVIKGKQSGLCIDVGSYGSCQDSPWNGYAYCNMNLDPVARAKDLVSRLNYVEMVRLMISDQIGIPRLGIPRFGHTECTHGTLNDGILLTTLFPQALTFARSFDRRLVYSIARAISDEVRGKHNDANKIGKYNYPFGLVCWAPVVNVCRDPRWGRCQEGYGEDPYLQGELAKEYITALQNINNSKYVQAIATCKHFDVHSGPDNIPESRFQFDAQVSYRDWIDTFQPAFKACLEAGVLSYMCSYNAINGVPSCANYELLTELLRLKWKFDGFVVSDCGAVRNVYSYHHFARSDTEAAEFCVKAGCDWNCGFNAFSSYEYDYLVTSVQDGTISEETLSTSVERIMKAFIMLGQLDPPSVVPYSNLTLAVVDNHVPLNKKAAMESIVLLENPNRVLPLDLSQYESVAIIGPCADNPTCSRGDYDPDPKYITTVKSAFDDNTNLKVLYSQGCADVQCEDYSGLADALKVAMKADFIVYVGGISKDVEGESNDRSNISLPGLQTELIRILRETHKTLIVVVMHGAPVPSPVYSEVDAVISAGYPGQEGGNAVLSVITGDYNPSGKLVVTWYTSNDQLPPMVSYSMTNRTYRYMKDEPQYYFGYGLSYTSFNYTNLKIQTSTIKPCQSVEVDIDVVNTGKVTGDEIVEFYMTFKNATVPTPNIKLVGFEHESEMKINESRTVKATIMPPQMTVVTEEDFVEVIEPGTYIVYAGGSQPGDSKAPANVLMGSFTVSGDVTPLTACNQTTM